MFEVYFEEKRKLEEYMAEQADEMEADWLNQLTEDEKERYDKYQLKLFVIEYAYQQKITKLMKEAVQELYREQGYEW